ncbi:18800_t:CDS:2, partial [Gigaspora margarita]
MSNFSSLIAHGGSKCSNEEWSEYVEMPQVRTNETSRMERHWASHCTGNSYCGVSYDEYLLKIKKKSISGYDYDNEYALHRYGLWMQNAIRKIECARAVGRKIRACTIIQRKVVEWIYHPEGLTAQELALHYACLQNIRTEMRQ